MEMIVNEIQPRICTDSVDINPELIYFATTKTNFLIYDFETEVWRSINTNLEINQSIYNSFDKDGCLNLLVPGMAIETGKWYTSENMDDVLDFYNSKEYLKYI
jgi:hypothetical protein